MAQKPLIYLISCSIREGGNSDIAVEHAKKYITTDRKTLYLKDYNDEWEPLKNELKKADGIIFATPVYFGDCSSLLYEFLKYCEETKADFFNKVIGFITIGAKRNGGQETAIVHSAWQVMERGALVVNDGHPISQFGGTCVAGKRGSIRKDEQGLKQIEGLAKRIQETVLFLQNGDRAEPINLTWLLMQPPKEEDVKTPTLIDYEDKIQVIRTYQRKFDRCRGCEVCPGGDSTKDFKCQNYRDDMHKIHDIIAKSHALIPLGFDMRFLERMRYLRRDNFRLTYHVVRVSEMRHVHIFIKQNSILCRHNAVNYAKQITSGRRKVIADNPKYEAVGH